MKRTLTNIVLTFGSAFGCVASLPAQTSTLKANIPFSFQESNRTHDAGRYLISTNDRIPYLSLRASAGTRSSLLGLSTQTETNKGGPRLVFHRYGNQYFLAEVWNRQSGTKLPRSAREKEIQRTGRGVDSAQLTIVCDSPFSGS